MFIEKLRTYGGTPKAVFEHEELIEIFLPILRADFSLVESRRYVHETPLDCGITAFGGLEDREVSHDDIAGWKEQTTNKFILEMLPGNHFFLNTQRESLLRIIFRHISEIIGHENFRNE